MINNDNSTIITNNTMISSIIYLTASMITIVTTTITFTIVNINTDHKPAPAEWVPCCIRGAS